MVRFAKFSYGAGTVEAKPRGAIRACPWVAVLGDSNPQVGTNSGCRGGAASSQINPGSAWTLTHSADNLNLTGPLPLYRANAGVLPDLTIV
jgi:hypothetical protein